MKRWASQPRNSFFNYRAAHEQAGRVNRSVRVASDFAELFRRDSALKIGKIILTGQIGKHGSNCSIAWLTNVEVSGHPSSLPQDTEHLRGW